MTKFLKLLSITTLSTPLIMISCSQHVPLITSKVEIDRIQLENNFIKTDPLFDLSSIDKFVNNFNENPQNYFISPTNVPSDTVVPFIKANTEHFVIDNQTKKPIMSAQSVPNVTLPSFKTIKFTFKLKPEYQSLIVSPIDFPDSFKSSTFSMQFRTELPILNSESRKIEIEWIHNFFKKLNITYINSDIEKEMKAKTHQEMTPLIQNKMQFEKIFKFEIPFPNSKITGWMFEVKAESAPELVGFPEDSIKLTFTLSNALFTGNNVLTPEETNVELDYSGYKVPKV